MIRQTLSTPSEDSATEHPGDLLLITLTAVAASTDAVSYLGFGSVFPANMTGNTVLLGIGLASGDYAGAGRSLVALGAFVTGAMAAGLVLGGRPWRSMLAAATAAEFALLAATCGWWLAAGDTPSDATTYGLIALVSAAMGAQSATVSGFRVGVSTTYITGTWTSVSTWAASLIRPVERRSPPPDSRHRHARQLTVVVTYFCAALLAGFLEHIAGAPAIALPLGLLTFIAVAVGLARPRRQQQRPPAWR